MTRRAAGVLATEELGAEENDDLVYASTMYWNSAVFWENQR